MVTEAGRRTTDDERRLSLEDAGYEIVQNAVSLSTLTALRGALAALEIGPGVYDRRGVYAARDLLERIPEVKELAFSDKLNTLVEPILGRAWRPVRGIYFDKSASANWKVPWHQDLTIAVCDRREVEGFGPWSMKADVPHVQPPVAILEQMLAVRIALDDNDESNGPLRVLPGTHRLGRLQPADIARLRDEIPEANCIVPAGGAVLMRPLLLHASSPMLSGKRRRVIHIEYAGCDLPGGLEWRS